MAPCDSSFSSAVPRAKYLIAKCVGAWLGLVVPIAIPILISILLLFVYAIPFAVAIGCASAGCLVFRCSISLLHRARRAALDPHKAAIGLFSYSAW